MNYFQIMRTLLLSLLLLAPPAFCQTPAAQVSDMRGDTGLLQDFGPTGAAWLDGDHLLVCDRRYNVFHIFDTNGRRYRLMDFEKKQGDANYDALCHWKGDQFFVAGSHYHTKNHPRYVENRSVIHRITVHGEELGPDSGKENYRPDVALRSSGFYGESSEQNGEVTGIAFDTRHNRFFLSMDRCLNHDGTVVVLEGRLDDFLARKADMKLKPLPTGIKPATDPATGTPYGVTDLAYVPNKGLLLLLSPSPREEGARFGTNQIWYLRGGFGPAKSLMQDVAPGNHATGLAIRPANNKDEYEAALVCDNAMEDTHVPSRLVILRGMKL